MSKYFLVVLTNPRPGREEEYNEWYSNQHLADVLKVPGFVAAQRFAFVPDSGSGLPGSYLALYEMETDDPVRAAAGLSVAREAGRMPVSDAMDSDSLGYGVFVAMGERKTAAK